MIIENQLIEVKITNSNRKHYENLGYSITNTIIKAPPCDLPLGTRLKVLIQCDTCSKKVFKPRAGLNFDGNQFCSNSCAGKYKFTYKNPNPTKAKISVNCEQCEKEFYVSESIKKKNKWHFCTRDCYAEFRHENLKGEKIYNYQDIKSNCLICNKGFKTSKWHQDNDKDKFCSQECYYTYRSIHYIGEKHPRYGVKWSEDRINAMRIVTASRIANGSFPQTETSIHVKIREILKRLKFDFEEEFQFKYFVLDFYDKNTNLAIEVMGDYWHANPKRYPIYDELQTIQKKDVKRDKSKRTYLKKYENISILYLWELDINKNSLLCEKLIELYILRNGVLDDYNSFNYHLTSDGEISLNTVITQPYFMVANTQLQVSHI